MTSTIKVDNITKVSDGSNIIKKCGSTITVGSGSGQTIVADGATITLGRCGGAVNLASGATQTGFGRTGTVDWCTTAKTSPFTAASGDGFFIDTSSGTVTVTLPSSPSAGAIVSFADYASNWGNNKVTVCNNSSKINGGAFPVDLTTTGQSVTLVYVDATRGWKTVQDSTEDVTGQPNFVSATGGTATTCGDYKIHTFTSSGSLVVTQGAVSGNNKVSYIVVAGGGGAGSNHGGGGGAGGFREGKLSSDPYTASPLAATPCSALSVTSQSYPITVGAGGNGATVPTPYAGATNGSDSVFSTITSTGGGRGGTRHDGANSGYHNGSPGGSGGGTGGENGGASAGSGNDPSVSPSQGNGGGAWSPPYYGGGGGGATAAGSPGTGAAGGNGAGTGINPASPVGTPGPSAPLRYFAGGGGAGNSPATPTPNGPYGGGGAGYSSGCGTPNAFQGTVNTGGGGGAVYGCGLAACATGIGGSGIVIVRYKFQ